MILTLIVSKHTTGCGMRRYILSCLIPVSPLHKSTLLSISPLVQGLAAMNMVSGRFGGPFISISSPKMDNLAEFSFLFRGLCVQRG